MCNCGSKRIVSQQSSRSVNTKPVQTMPAKRVTEMPFEYVGNTGLTVTGSVTGKRYRYAKKGDVVMIDYRDSYAMLKVPVLKRKQQ